MLIDLADQIFKNELDLSTLNQSLSNFMRSKSNAETVALNLAVPSESNGASAVHAIDRQENAPTFVTQSEFGGLTDTLTVLAGQIDGISRKQANLDSKILGVTLNSTSFLSKKEHANSISEIWYAINSSNGLVEFLQNVIASVSNSNADLEQRMNGLSQTVGLLQNNRSGTLISGLYGDEFIYLLDASVRDIRIEVNEQRTWLTNQRRRIRQIEGMRELLTSSIQLLNIVHNLYSIHKPEQDYFELLAVISIPHSNRLLTVAELV